MISTLNWLIEHHPWPDGAPLWAHAACTLVPFAILGLVYIRSRLVGDSEPHRW